MEISARGVLVALVLIEAAISTLGVAPILKSALDHGELPMTPFGFRLLEGPFDKLGISGVIVAGLVFASLSSVKFLAAWWIAGGRLDGAVLQLALIGASTLFWYGFALPYGVVVGLTQVPLIAVAWSQLA